MDALNLAINLRATGRLKESNELLLELVKKHSENAAIQYQCAWSFDVLGLERDAIPYYEKAISLGLPEDDLKGAFLGLGSTYRALGEYVKSKTVFTKALELFPEDNAIKTFYAMTLYNLGEFSSAMKMLLKNLANTSSDENIKQYGKAIKLYADDLDKIW